MTGINLQKFRKALSSLKKQGLIPGNKIDARSAYPSQKRAGKRLETYVEKYSDLISGKVTAVKVPAKNLKAFRKAGYETAQGRVLVPHSATETAKAEGRNIVVENRFTGIQRVAVPVEYHKLDQWLKEMAANRDEINAMKKRNEYFGVRFFGNHTATYYRDILDLIETLTNYRDVYSNVGRPRKGAEVYRNIEIVRIGGPGVKEWERTAGEFRKKRDSKVRQKARAKKYRERMEDSPKYHAAIAERMRKYRARMKGSKKKAYNREGNKRRKKSDKGRP